MGDFKGSFKRKMQGDPEARKERQDKLAALRERMEPRVAALLESLEAGPPRLENLRTAIAMRCEQWRLAPSWRDASRAWEQIEKMLGLYTEQILVKSADDGEETREQLIAELSEMGWIGGAREVEAREVKPRRIEQATKAPPKRKARTRGKKKR